MQKLPSNRASCAASLMAVAAVMPLAYSNLTAGESGYVSHSGPSGYESGIVARTKGQMTERASEAEVALAEGDRLYNSGDYEGALNQYSTGLALLPNAPLFATRRDDLISRVADASLALAATKRKNGDYAKAEELLNNVLKYDPDNKMALTELARLNDPEYSNPALSPQHVEDVRQVNRLLAKGEGYYNLGKYDEADREFNAVLRIDPYNSAARRFQEKVIARRSSYYSASYDEMRARALAEVEASWQSIVPSVVPSIGPENNTGSDSPAGGSAAIMQELRSLRVTVDFRDITLEDAVEFLRGEARKANKSINFVIDVRDGSAPEAAADLAASEDEAPIVDIQGKRISRLSLSNIPMLEALNQITETTGLRYKVTDYVVKIVPAGDGGANDLYTRTYTVPPNFYSTLEGMSSAGGGEGGGDGASLFDGDSEKARLKPRRPIDELLKLIGVSFPDGSSASYIAPTSTLVVRNSLSNIDLIEQIIEDLQKQTPKQIKVSTKFVEITQKNTDELGFDWLLGPVSVNSTNGESFIGGGTVGNGASRTNADFISPVGTSFIPGVPTQDGVNVSNLVTGGNRTGDFAVSRDNIDAFLNNSNRSAQNPSAAPGILNYTGIFTDGTVQMIMRGLSQKKGADVMTAPSIMARPGETATIEVIREFIYPTEYEPPQLPNQVGGGGISGGGDGGTPSGGFPVTPATPTAFETRNTGVTLEIEPTLGDNDYVIDLRFSPEIVEFEGFINYGSPIQATATDAIGNSLTLTITENRIEMPVFSTRRVNTSLTVYDGHTVAIGGLISETVQNIEDKIPILGDLPLVGRLFQTKAEDRQKSNLMIFVSARIIDATGKAIREDVTSTSVNAGGDASLLPTPTDSDLPIGLDGPSF